MKPDFSFLPAAATASPKVSPRRKLWHSRRLIPFPDAQKETTRHKRRPPRGNGPHLRKRQP
ncbi:hypothetical protein CBM2615_A280317 [Cupriavidus taiwanensis]|uniref:Uncharacterized protein n=1 Tax=Cupriavidus taiwanensis TaxID=164546 RepID=A0A375E259_9BURK|nr:hypothetical protein CBM2615_A280317 [Cupriavidus taiwanensis]SOZ57296.1 hypothetical protein CBM2614_A250322 [Cupriavidus taiwanensis]SOZ59706.1 hypothetical protein CBM2613_A250319 [Cupriavidus taiwanensis]SPA05797.1 hypothetical protein CBM2625_A200322 [Cupriavidus taiwanensis]